VTSITAPAGAGSAARVTLRHILIGAILAKPVVDLFWQVELVGTGRFGLTPQRFLALVVPFLCVAIIATTRRTILLREKGLYGFLAVAALAVMVNGPSPSAVDQFLRWVTILGVLAIALTLLPTEQDLVLVLGGLVVVSLLPTLICYLQLVGIVPFYYAEFEDVAFATEAATGIFESTQGTFGEGVGRASGGYLHPTGYTNYVFVAVPAAYALFRVGRLSLVGLLAFLLVTLPAVFFTYDRTAYILLSGQLTVMLLFSDQRRFFRLVMLSMIVTVGIFVGPILWSLVRGGVGQLARFDQLFRGRGLVWLIYADHWLRGDLWQQLIGFGGVALEDVPISKGAALDEPHSDYLRVLFTYGLVGLLMYLKLLWSAFRGAWHMAHPFHPGGTETGRTMGVVALMILLAAAGASLLKEPLRYTAFGWPFALLVAAAIARRSGLFVVE